MTSNNSDNIFIDNTKTKLNDSTKLILKYWYSKCKIFYKCHKDAGHYYDYMNKYMGVPAVLMGIFNTTTIFTNYNAQNQTLSLVNGSACFVATVLSALQNYFDLGKLSNMHSKQANGYSKIVNTIEKILMYERLTNNNEISSKIIDNIMNQMELLQHDSPNIPSRIWNKYNTELKSMVSVIINNDSFISEIASVTSSKNSTVEDRDDCKSIQNQHNQQNKKIINQPQEIVTPERNDDKRNDKQTIEIVYDNSSK